MKVAPDAVGRLLDKPDGKSRLYLFYGPDDSGARAHATRLERALGQDIERIELSGTQLKDDPAILSDEAASISLFGGTRMIRVNGGDECTEAVESLLGLTVPCNVVAMIAGGLKANGALLKRVLNDPAVVACQCYKPEDKKADELAIMIGRNHGVRLAPSVARTLAGQALADRAVIEREIEKIALYLDAAPDRPREADQATLDAIGAGIDDGNMGPLVNAVLEGRVADSAGELAVLEETGASFIPVLRSAARRCALLARLQAGIASGQRKTTMVEAGTRGLPLTEKQAIERQVDRWDAPGIAAATARLFAVESAIKASGTAGDILAANVLLGMARRAAQRR